MTLVLERQVLMQPAPNYVTIDTALEVNIYSISSYHGQHYQNSPEQSVTHMVQVRLERVWGILQMPVTAKLDWVIRYTGQEAGGLFEPALQAWEQAAAAVLERERCCSADCDDLTLTLQKVQVLLAVNTVYTLAACCIQVCTA